MLSNQYQIPTTAGQCTSKSFNLIFHRGFSINLIFILSGIYSIACILQAELFDDLNNLQSGVELLNPELNIYTSLPAHLGGIQTRIPDDVMERETAEDFELRVQLEAGTVPTVDTILR